MKYATKILVLVIFAAMIAGLIFYRRVNFDKQNPFPDTFITEKSEYNPPKHVFSLQDDSLSPGDVPAFDPHLVHPQQVQGWEINISQAVFKLDTPLIKPDSQHSLLKVYPDYSKALESHLYALETFLLPQNGQESAKLCLTANYKRRMIDAFSASSAHPAVIHDCHAQPYRQRHFCFSVAQ